MKMGSYEMVKKKRKKIVRYLGILGISIYSCEVHGNVLGIVLECYILQMKKKKGKGFVIGIKIKQQDDST